MLSKRIIIPVAVAAIGTAGLIGTGVVFAQTNPQNGLAQAIASHFNLDQTQVQQFIADFREQKMQGMEDQRLTNLVSQGKITNDQKTAIENEITSLKSKYLSNLQNMTPDQRRQAMQSFRTDFEAWLKSQNINLNFGHAFYMGGKGGRMHKMMGPKPSPSASSQT
jgi:uncharacterized protein YjaZ